MFNIDSNSNNSIILEKITEVNDDTLDLLKIIIDKINISNSNNLRSLSSTVSSISLGNFGFSNNSNSSVSSNNSTNLSSLVSSSNSVYSSYSNSLSHLSYLLCVGTIFKFDEFRIEYSLRNNIIFKICNNYEIIEIVYYQHHHIMNIVTASNYSELFKDFSITLLNNCIKYYLFMLLYNTNSILLLKEFIKYYEEQFLNMNFFYEIINKYFLDYIKDSNKDINNENTCYTDNISYSTMKIIRRFYEEFYENKNEKVLLILDKLGVS